MIAKFIPHNLLMSSEGKCKLGPVFWNRKVITAGRMARFVNCHCTCVYILFANALYHIKSWYIEPLHCALRELS